MTGNRSGFTLVEFLVALVILMVGLLGMLQSITVALDKNLENLMRGEAIMLADEMVMAKRARVFEALSTTVADPPWSHVQRNVRGIFKNYSVQEIVSQPTQRSKEVVINVSWNKKNARYNHSISTVVSTF